MEARKQMLENTSLENNVYCNFSGDGIDSYVHAHSVKMIAVNSVERMELVRKQCKAYVRDQNIDEILWPSFRLLVNLKFRGYQQGASAALFTDVNNKNITMHNSIPARMRVNECAVFEWEILENTIRNYFYNASRREFVNFKRPSWRADPDDI